MALSARAGVVKEKSSKTMTEPCSGRELKRDAEGPVERSERLKKAMKGSKEPNMRVNLSETPKELILLENCCSTLDASVRPAMAFVVLFDVGVFHPNCCCEARLWNWDRSS